jgi:hypothetical protein
VELFRAPFYIVFMSPYPLIVRPMEFRLVFGSLASHVSLWSWSFSSLVFFVNSFTSLLTRAEFCIRVFFIASPIWSHRVYFCVNHCILFSIQFTVAFATELQRKSCESFLGNTGERGWKRGGFPFRGKKKWNFSRTFLVFLSSHLHIN